MNLDEAREGAAAKSQAWDTTSHASFYSYYEQQSLSEKTMERFRLITEALLRLLESRQDARTLDVLDVGCGAGAQSKFWRFSYYGLRRHLDPMGFDCLDRFHLVDTRGKGAAARVVLGAMRCSSLLRWLGHVTTPYTLVGAVKRAGPPLFRPHAERGELRVPT